MKLLVEVIEQRGWTSKRIGIDKRDWSVPIATYEALIGRLRETHDAARVVEVLRMVKSLAEIAKLERLAAYVDAGMRVGQAAVRVCATENELVSAMMAAAISAGSEYMGMEPLVSAGRRTGVPHGT